MRKRQPKYKVYGRLERVFVISLIRFYRYDYTKNNNLITQNDPRQGGTKMIRRSLFVKNKIAIGLAAASLGLSAMTAHYPRFNLFIWAKCSRRRQRL